ncbi:patatin family protein [uncultured Bacteroides sp.]|uniref:patatin-like phospholipase family protein n=1 Tax=uncultured Bacteroides sp. TaxID=162156 RepID=UPI0025F31E54|nr:patatin family protein [uncultured Bacteroides sp.]
MNNQTALVLEGGGMRCVFTAGVLDCFMQAGISFPYTIAVSGGCINGLSYMSGQQGRSRDIMIKYLKQEKYIGFMNYLQNGSFINFRTIFEKYDETGIPFNFEAYRHNPNRFVVVTSNCLTGKAMYLEEKQDKQQLYRLCEASSSLPVYCPLVEVNGIPMYDGGVCDAIPYQRPLDEGFNKLIVVLTHRKEYRKDEQKEYTPHLLFRNFPMLRFALGDMHYRYNRMLEKLQILEDMGKVVVIRPSDEMGVDTLTRNKDNLVRLYEEGFRVAHESLESIRNMNIVHIKESAL